MTEPLHDDDLDGSYELPDGRVIRNLTAEEYAATYAEGTGGHEIPVDVMELAELAAARHVDPDDPFTIGGDL